MIYGESHLLVMNADTLTMLSSEAKLKQKAIFNVTFHLRAIFQKVVALSGRFFYQLVSLRVSNAAPCRSVSHVDRGWWASPSAQCCCRAWASLWTVVGERRLRPSVAVVDGVVFGPLLDIWNLFLCLL